MLFANGFAGRCSELPLLSVVQALKAPPECVCVTPSQGDEGPVYCFDRNFQGLMKGHMETHGSQVHVKLLADTT